MWPSDVAIDSFFAYNMENVEVVPEEVAERVQAEVEGYKRTYRREK